ncbi:MAG: hypothetical protein ACYC9Q_09245 [Bacillota bacterium]
MPHWQTDAIAMLLLGAYTYGLLFLYARKLDLVGWPVQRQPIKEPLTEDRADRVIKALSGVVPLDRPVRSGNVVRFFTVLNPSTGRVRVYHVGMHGLHRTEVRRGTSA